MLIGVTNSFQFVVQYFADEQKSEKKTILDPWILSVCATTSHVAGVLKQISLYAKKNLMTSFESIKEQSVTKRHIKRIESMTNLWNKKSLRMKHVCNRILNIEMICCDFSSSIFLNFKFCETSSTKSNSTKLINTYCFSINSWFMWHILFHLFYVTS